jgi:uncharacterized protein
MAHWRSKELTICITDACNMNCAYCYPGDYKKSSMTIPYRFGITAINYFLGEQRGPCQLNRVRFYALGEPTLEMDLVRTFYEHAKAVGPADTSFEIQTNGTFSDNDAVWIAEHMHTVWVSLDGPPDIHDSQRPYRDGTPTSPVVLRNVEILRDGKCMVGLRPTVTGASLGRMKAILDFAVSLNVDALYFHHGIKPQGKSMRTSGSLYLVPLLDFAVRYLEDVVPHIPARGLFVGNFLTINFDETSSHYCRSCLPSPQLTVDGYISACDKAPLGGDQRFSDMIFGKWNEEHDTIELWDDRIKRLRDRRVENMDPCARCEIAYNCGGGCLGEANFLYGDMFQVIDEYCEAVKLLAAHLPRNTGECFPFTHP